MPRWHLIYFVLAAFDIITVCISLALSHRLMETYADSVATNQVWADRLGTFQILAGLAAEVNQPGNDVFDSHDVQAASAILDHQYDEFREAWKHTREDLVLGVESQMVQPLLVEMDRAEQSMQDMVSAARDIFLHFEDNQKNFAGTRMAEMDHHFYATNTTLGNLARKVRKIQSSHFENQNAMAKSMRSLEYIIAGFIGLMVLGVTIYGHNLSRTMKEHHNERDDMLEEFHILRSALDSTANAIVITDHEGKMEWVNPAFTHLTGYGRDEAASRNISPLHSRTQRQDSFERMWEALRRGDTWRDETTNRRKDGALYYEEQTITPVFNQTGKIIRYIAIKQDITERKNMQMKMQGHQWQMEESNLALNDAFQRAEQAAQTKSNFLANMSHEIRTPMTAILGYTDLLLDSSNDHADSAHAVQTIKRNGEHLLTIINDILDISKLESGQMTVERILMSPHEVLSDVESLMRLKAEDKGLSFSVEFMGPVPATIESDPTRLRQILINLIGNAIKFTDEGGVRLIVKLVHENESEEPQLRFEIVDSGIGMSKEQIDTLFQPFHQADASTTRKYGGTGLGLTISRHFTELLGGDINITCIPGEGCTFFATIATGSMVGVRMIVGPVEEMPPVASPSSPLTPDTTLHTEPDSPLGGLRLLLVEDGPDNQRLISFHLKKAGAEVEVAENGKIGFDLALEAQREAQPFAVILMDMQMPVMDGYTATEELRRSGYGRPIIALTAHAMAEDRHKCLEAGCDEYMTKPIDKAKLIEMVARYAALHHETGETPATTDDGGEMASSQKSAA